MDLRFFRGTLLTFFWCVTDLFPQRKQRSSSFKASTDEAKPVSSNTLSSPIQENCGNARAWKRELKVNDRRFTELFWCAWTARRILDKRLNASVALMYSMVWSQLAVDLSTAPLGTRMSVLLVSERVTVNSLAPWYLSRVRSRSPHGIKPACRWLRTHLSASPAWTVSPVSFRTDFSMQLGAFNFSIILTSSCTSCSEVI